MYSSWITCHAICFILVQIIVTGAINQEFLKTHNITSSNAFHENSVRSKRSLFEKMPTELNIRVKYETGQEIKWTWKRKRNYLANEYLPVITSSGYPLPIAMSDVGEFVVYQDYKGCAAVVYFEKLKAMFGVIGMNHYVTNLPYRFNELGDYPEVVGEPYVKKREFSPVHNLPQLPDMLLAQFLNPMEHDSHQILKASFDSNPGPSSKRQRTERDFEHRSDPILMSEKVLNISNIRKRRHFSLEGEYYLETLNFVTKDVVKVFKTSWGDHFIEWLVRYYIIYFNAVDMMFRKLRCSQDTLRINIAKIVIEDNETPFDSVGNNQLMDNLPQYLQSHNAEYPRDSFDHIFIFATQQVVDNAVPIHSFTKFDANLYEARKRGEFYNAVPKTLIEFSDTYVIAVHEIAKTLKVGVDAWYEGVEGSGQCSSVMQEGSSKCDKCLTWSHASRQSFHNFWTKDQHRCFLLNPPRSLQPPGRFIILTPNIQCHCFGYDSFLKAPRGVVKISVPNDECSQPLQCIKLVEGRERIEDTVEPFDGTRCSTSNKKVCWNRECE